MLSGILVVDGRCAGFEGGIDVEDRGEDLVLHLDEIEGLLGDLFGGGRNEGHRIAHVPHLLVEDAHVAGCAAPEVGDVFPREDRLHTAERQGLALVDPLDEGVGVGTSQHLAVEEVLELQIVRVLYRPGDDVVGVPAGPSVCLCICS